MNDATHTSVGPHFLIAGYGAEGVMTVALLEQSEWMQADKVRKDSIHFVRLEKQMNTKNISEMLAGIVIVFILGSDDDISAPPSALELALQCRKNGITCFTALTITAPPGQMDVATESLCNLSSNFLPFPAKKPVNNLISCFLLKEAVMTIIGPLLGYGLVSVDSEDMRLMLSHGRNIHFGLGMAEGENRAVVAAQRAIKFAPEVRQAKSIIGNITHGSDFVWKEYTAVSNLLQQTAGDDCVFVLCTTPDVAMQRELRVGISCVTKAQPSNTALIFS